MQAPAIFVGEQPGFAEGGCYLTNAVKHFKFVPRGKRRIHKTPSAREIDHCRWWLDRELAPGGIAARR